MHYSFGFGVLVGCGFITGGLFASAGFCFSGVPEVSVFDVETLAFELAFALLLAGFGELV